MSLQQIDVNQPEEDNMAIQLSKDDDRLIVHALEGLMDDVASGDLVPVDGAKIVARFVEMAALDYYQELMEEIEELGDA